MKQMLRRKPFSKMEGFSLMEVILALVISFVVVASVIAAFWQARINANANRVVKDMSNIVAATASYVAAGNAITAATQTTLGTAGLIPSPFNSPWGTAYTIAGTSTGVDITVGGIVGTGDKNCAAITGLVGTAATASPSGTACKFTYTL